MKIRKLLFGAILALGVVAVMTTVTACGTTAVGEPNDDTVSSSPPDSTSGSDGMDDTVLIDNNGLGSDDGMAGEEATSASIDGVDVTCPEGWVIGSSNDEQITVRQQASGVELVVETNPTTDSMPDASAWANNTRETMGDGATVEEHVIAGATWYGVVDGGGIAFYADGGDNTIVSVVGDDTTVDDVKTVLEGITIG